MAGIFGFRKRILNNNSKSDMDRSDTRTNSTVMDNAVFPVSFDDADASLPLETTKLDLDSMQEDVESVTNKIVNENKTAVKSISLPQNSGLAQDSNKEGSVSISENRGGIRFATRTIPGVIDGGRPGGRPVLTPVRRTVAGAPIKLKSVAKPIEEVAPAAKVEFPKPATSGLKVITKSLPIEGEKTKTQFGLQARPADALKKSSFLNEKSIAHEEYVKPKGDQRVLYYQLMNGLYDAVLVLDDEGHVVDCNDRVKKVLGFTREDAWDLPIEQVIKGMNSQMYAHLKRNLAENHHILITARCYRSDGESFKGEIGVSTLSLTRENNVVFAIRNVDQRKSAMAELRKSAAAFEVALVPAFACNLEGYFTAVNQALMDALGMTDEKEAKKVRFVDILPDGARAFVKCLAGEKHRETLRTPTADGQPIKVEIALVPIMNGREVIGIAGSILQL